MAAPRGPLSARTIGEVSEAVDILLILVAFVLLFAMATSTRAARVEKSLEKVARDLRRVDGGLRLVDARTQAMAAALPWPAAPPPAQTRKPAARVHGG
jgi:hypothetical protein